LINDTHIEKSVTLCTSFLSNNTLITNVNNTVRKEIIEKKKGKEIKGKDCGKDSNIKENSEKEEEEERGKEIEEEDEKEKEKEKEKKKGNGKKSEDVKEEDKAR
jgi:IS5 family transposase